MALTLMRPALLFLVVSAPLLASAVTVTETTTFDPTTSLYTYTYDVSHPNTVISEFVVMVQRGFDCSTGTAYPWCVPNAHTEPVNTAFYFGSGGWSDNGILAQGTVWSWQMSAGTGEQIFSFTSQFGPVQRPILIFSPDPASSGGTDYFDAAFGPALPDSKFAPEPATFLGVGMALCAVAAARRRHPKTPRW